PCRQSTLGTVV
ncbi:hypothetical protein VCHENC02_3643B, partial [Vibrio harveyi]